MLENFRKKNNFIKEIMVYKEYGKDFKYKQYVKDFKRKKN